MSIIIAFFCGMALITLADAIADYISAKAHEIEANSQYLKNLASYYGLKARNELQNTHEEITGGE